MIDPAGVEWVPLVRALERVPGLNGGTLRSWVRRGRVRSHRVGRSVWVAWEDVLECEGVAFLAGYRRGRRPGGGRGGGPV
nr:MAG TPA: Pyocin activator protein PrtN [Caudoviricetes sp.]